MTPFEAFFTLHRDLPREGPGTAEDVLWALDVANIGPEAGICDAGCGPGADTETLAGACARARITAIDAIDHFVAATQARTSRFGARVQAIQGDMRDIQGPYDLIWSAGALYFLGVRAGLDLWRGALAEGGVIAFSEPVLLSAHPSATVREFWKDYPAIQDAAGIAATVEQAGYEVIGQRLITGMAWDAYYNPLADRITALRASDPPAALRRVLADAEHEIHLWRRDAAQIAYMLFVVQTT